MVRHARSRRHVRCSKPATMITAGMHQRGATKSTLGSSVAVIIIVIALLTAVPVGAQTPIPQLALWEANMRSYGQLACEYLGQPHSFDEYLTEVYYDAERAFQQVAEYTGDGAWLTCAQRAAAIYRDQYVMGAPCWGGGFGCVPGYWNFTHGLTMVVGQRLGRRGPIALVRELGFRSVDTIPGAARRAGSQSRHRAGVRVGLPANR